MTTNGVDLVAGGEEEERLLTAPSTPTDREPGPSGSQLSRTSSGLETQSQMTSQILNINRLDFVVDKVIFNLLDCQVAFLFSDPLSTAVVERGLASRGLSVDKARRLVNNEIQMREATQFQGKFLSSCRE